MGSRGSKNIRGAPSPPPLGSAGTGAGIRTAPMSDALVSAPPPFKSDETIPSSSSKDKESGGGGDDVSTASPTSAPPRGGSGSGATVRHEDPQVKTLPVIIRFKDPEVKTLLERKKPVVLLTQHRNWQPLPMTASEDNYYAITDLPEGVQLFRFKVDGVEQVDGSQPTDGTKTNNTISVQPQLLQTTEDDELADDPSGWGQETVMFEETRKYPPILPPHLRYTPLNTPPTQLRCAPNGSILLPEAFASQLDAEHLPLPLTVTINHVYFQRREDHTVIGVTTRCRNKYTTVVYYKTK